MRRIASWKPQLVEELAQAGEADERRLQIIVLYYHEHDDETNRGGAGDYGKPRQPV
jgi:hypothetical protein